MNTIKHKIKELVLDNVSIKVIIGLIVLPIGAFLYLLPITRLSSIRYICWIGRVLDVKIFERISTYFIKNWFLINTANCYGTVLSNICLNSDFLDKSVGTYSLSGGEVSLFRDIILLKEKSDIEKGVLLIKYTPAFDAFYYHFDVDKILLDYYLVLEPSWAGYCDPSFLMFWRNSKQKSVIIQAIEPKDFTFIEALDGNFVPIDIGSSDWVDQDIFCYTPDVEKIYDLVMVSNWALHKKHRELFKALSLTHMNLSVLLIGFAAEGRTRSDIEREIKEFDLNHINIEIKESIPATEVAELLNKSKVYLLLSKKEGPNKAIIEAFSVNVPAILYDKFVGGAQMKINPETGVLSSYENLKDNIEYMVINHYKLSPRNWIEKNSGSKMSTLKLNDLLKNICMENGEQWITDIVEKVNSPNLCYKNNPALPIDSKITLSSYKR